MLFHLFICFVLFISLIHKLIISLQHFEDLYGFGDDDEHGCHSAVACFWLIMHKAMAAGDIREVIGSDGYNRGQWVSE